MVVGILRWLARREARAILVLTYFVFLAFYLLFVLAHQRSYQDSWLLEDIFWPTAVLIVLGLLAAFAARSASLAALLVSSLAFALNIVPALKYDLFYGVGDVPGHYSMVRSIVESGQVPTGLTYSEMPGSHLLVSSISLVTGLTSGDAFKLAPPLYLGSLPLIAYLAARRCCQHEDLQKSIVIAAIVPAFGFFTLSFKGSIGGFFFLFLLLALLVARGNQSRGQTRAALSLASILTVLAMVVHHGVTALFTLIALLCSTLVLLICSKSRFWTKATEDSRLSSPLHVFTALAGVVVIGWWMYQADFIFGVFVREMRDLVELVEPRKPPIPARFGQISLVDQVRVLIATGRASYLVPAVLLAVGMGITVTRWRSAVFQRLRLATLFGAAVLVPASALAVSELARGYGSLEIERFAGYGILASPVFAGVAIWHLREHGSHSQRGTGVRKFAATGGLIVVLAIYLVSGFPPQPLVPSASALSETLPAGEPLAFFHGVNTVYQVRMISFADLHRGNSQFLVADRVTANQVPAFSSGDLRDHILYQSYLDASEELDGSRSWDLLLLHWPGKSGPLEEKAELRTKQRIYEITTAPSHNMVYDNGASFMVWRSPVDSK